jgi:hypothetical protein
MTSAVRMCVPLFFMLSGYLLLEKQEPLLYFLAKDLTRLEYQKKYSHDCCNSFIFLYCGYGYRYLIY